MSRAVYGTLDPSTEELIQEFPLSESAPVESAVARSGGAFERQRRRASAERAAIRLRLADRLESDIEGLAATMTLEMGRSRWRRASAKRRSAPGSAATAPSTASGDDDLLIDLKLSNEQEAALLGRREVAAVTLTGSSRAGRAVGAVAAGQPNPSVMELGDSDAFVVLDDADVAHAAEVGVQARCLNSGQSCLAAQRFIVHDAAWAAFHDAFVAGMRGQWVGDPRAEETTIGPLAHADLREPLAVQVDDALALGARALCGGEMPVGRGFFDPPTVLDGIMPSARAFREELFGPFAVLCRVGSDDEALALANATDRGLGASVWTRSPERAERFVAGLEAGSVFANGLVKSDPLLLFGGVEQSGFGSELGVEGSREFVNVETVWIA